MTHLLIKNGCVVTLDAQSTIHSPGWVSTEGNRIAAVGTGRPPDAIVGAASRTIDAAGMAVLPGLVNGHTHLEQVFMRGLGDGRPLHRWLEEAIWPLESAMTPADVYLAARLSLLENLKSGVTAIVQHHKITTSLEHVEAAARAAEEMGVRLLLARMWADLGTRAETTDQILTQMEQLHRRWHGAGGGRICVAFGPAVPWRCSDQTMRQMVEQARVWNLATHIHIDETREESAAFYGRTGKRQVEWLNSLGALGPDVQLAHCVWTDEAGLDLISRSGSIVVHCPTSNMNLASGIAPVRQMLTRGIPVAIGTDGAGAGGSQDMFETCKIAALLAKASTGDSAAISPMTALKMATSAGARLLGQNDLGRLVPNALADLILVRLDTIRTVPDPDPAHALIYGATGTDVHAVIVDGEVVLEEGRVPKMDEQALLDECIHAARRLREQVGTQG